MPRVAVARTAVVGLPRVIVTIPRSIRRLGDHNVDAAINLAMIIVSLVLILVVLLQTKGSSFSGAFGGDTSGIYKTRRGIEKTLFQFTIGIAVIFVALAIVSNLAS